MTDEDFMALALKQAQQAARQDEVPIGAIVVDPHSGQVIARAHNKTEHGSDVTAHAEITVIRKACKKLNIKRLWGLDLYITLEPCTMCAAAISFARIRRVIFGAEDIKGGAVFNGVKFYEQKTCHYRPEIVSGVCAEECGQLLKDFFKQKR